MIRVRTLLAICALALPISAVFAGCGGDDDEGGDEDPQQVLDATFSGENSVTSGNIDLSLGASAEGDQGGSVEFGLSGPFQGESDDPQAFPQLDLTATASGEGGGQSLDFEGALVVTEDNAFVEYQGQAYEVGTQQFSQLKDQVEAQAPQGAEGGVSFSEGFRQGCEQSIQAQGGDPAACDIDFNAWLSEPTNEGAEDIEGTETTHISGDLEVGTVLQDFVNLAAAIPGAEAQGLSPEAIEGQLGQIEEAIEEASFDVFSGTDDDILRGLDFTLAIDPTQIAGGESAGIDSFDLDFSLRLSGVNEDQTIEAPGDARPIEDLVQELGGLGGLGGLGLPGGGGLDVPGAGGGGGGASDPSAYFDCIEEAGNDPDAINACASEL